MYKLINLLPREYTQSMEREYVLRVITVGCIVVSIIVVASGVFLTPSFLLEQQEIKNSTQALAQISNGFATTEEKEVNARLTALAAKAEYLSVLGATPTASSILREILAVPHTGIQITHITLTAPAGESEGSVQIMGVATTRTVLQSYNAALGQLPSVSKTDLPIGDFAQATKIPFAITVSGTFTQK